MQASLLLLPVDLIFNKQPIDDGPLRGHHAKLNILYDDDVLLSKEEIDKLLNEYCKLFELEKKEKIK